MDVARTEPHTRREDGHLLAKAETENETETCRANTRPNSEHEINENVSSRQHLSVLPFALIVFYNVSGGPFGIEPTVRAGGPLFSILGFVFLMLIWSIPEALITAELGSTYPHASGGVAWVGEAFGRRASSIMGYISWISGATDNAIYPVLFLVYLKQVLHRTDDGETNVGDEEELEQGSWEALFLFGTATLLTTLNFLGLELVGNMSIVIAIISMSPFIVMCAVGVFKVKLSRLLILSSPNSQDFVFDDDNNGIDGDKSFLLSGLIRIPNFANVIWRPFLNNILWNVNSFDAVASLSTEVKDVKTVFAYGMKLSLVLVAISYLAPLVVALGATETNQEDWVDGYMATVAIDIVGVWLGNWIVIAAGIANIGLYMAELSADSYQVMGMAEKGLLPNFFARRSRFGTPTYGILLCYLVILTLLFNDYNDLVDIMNFNYILSLFMEYAAFIKLRIKNGNRVQPYRIPFSTFGCIVMIAPGLLLMLLVLLTSSYLTLIYSFGFLLFGLIGYYFQIFAKEMNWCVYADDEDMIVSNDVFDSSKGALGSVQVVTNFESSEII